MNVHDFLRDAVAILAASTLAVLICRKLNIPTLVGFLLTGVLIGPSGLGWVSSAGQVEVFAEIGVVFLLFTIGLEFSLERLKEIRRAFFFGGSAQTLPTIAVTALLAGLAGFTPPRALFLGFLLALSSTAIVLKLYSDRHELEAPHGKLMIGILLFQDFLIVPMIVLIPVLAGNVEASIAAVTVRFLVSLAAVSAVFVLARYLMPRLLYQFVRTRAREALVLGALLICLGLAWLTESLGFSLALGAFLAGIIISESEYSHQVVAEILPFRDVFNSVFFISIGMLLDLGFARQHPGSIAGLALLIVCLKALLTSGAVALLGFPARTSVLAGVGLAQIGEFSFVLLQVGRGQGMVTSGFFQTFIASAVLTMAATPLLVAVAPRLAERIPGPAAAGASPARELRDHVIVVGFGVNGQNLIRVLREAAIPYVVLELNPELVRMARRAGEPVIFGDSTRPEILEAAGISRARIVVFGISDIEAVRRSIRFARGMNRDVDILVRTRAVSEIADLRARGADEVIAEEFETSIEIFTRVLRRFHVPGNIIRAQTRALRGEDYLMLRTPEGGRQLSETLMRVLAEGLTDVYQINERHLRLGASIRDLALRKRTGSTIIAVVRNQKSFTNPQPDLDLEPGDSLVLVGNHAEIERAFDYLDGLAEDAVPVEPPRHTP